MKLKNKFKIINSLMYLVVSTLLLNNQLHAELESDLLAEEAALLAEIRDQMNRNNDRAEAQDLKQDNLIEEANSLEKKESIKASTKLTPKALPVEAKTKVNANINQKAISKKEIIASDVRESDIVDENTTLKSTLNQQEQYIASLKAKLAKQRDELLMAEAEVERLSKLMNVKRQNTLSATTGLKLNTSTTQSEVKPEEIKKVTYSIQDARKAAASKAQAEKMTPDMTIATVKSTKANLRTGPGKNNSPLMAVSKGTRLAVELRQGDWYRVISPTGMRAWVSADVVSFGSDRFSEPTRTMKIKGYSSAAEEQAFELIKQNLR
jgi:hypothetical protein